MKVNPLGRRSSSRDTPEGFEISIPAKRNLFLLLFMSAWLVGWAFGEVSAARQLLFGARNDSVLFLGAWLAAWTCGGGFALYAWLWMLNGREVIALRSDSLAIRRDVAGFGTSKEYELQHMKNLRIAASNPYDRSAGLQFWGIGGGPIAFDYGSQTVRVGSGVDEAEARDIIQELRSRGGFPQTS